MLKEILLAEAQKLDSPVELDSIFESVELSDEVKGNFSTVFEQAVKTSAVKLAESHIKEIAERSDVLVEEEVSKRSLEIETRLYEDTDKYFSHISEAWLAENKEAVSRDIKADLFTSLLESLKEVFIDHNVIIPEGQVDVVEELEDELVENQDEVKRLFAENQEQRKQIAEMNRERCVEKHTKELTESQIEKVQGLIEGLTYSDKFENKLVAIVEMVATKKEPDEVTDIKPIQETKDTFVPVEQPTKGNEVMNKYSQAARALS